MKDNEVFEVYITKYALTKGIIKCKAKHTGISDMIEVIYGKYRQCYHTEGIEWHKTIDLAIKKANSMKENKIISLNKKLKILNNLNFKNKIIDNLK